jgi:hypothetical protein
MTDFRTLCADLLQEFASLYSEMSARVDFNDTYTERVDKLLDRTSTALAQSEPQGPTDEELEAFAEPFMEVIDDGFTGVIHDEVAYARAVLARWGNSQGILDSPPQPVPVSERLPGPEDCSSRGYFWAYAGDDWEETDIDGMNWQHLHHHGYTHWLPHHALPIPATEAPS